MRRLTRKGWARPIGGAGDDQADHDAEPALEGREQAGDPAQGDGGVRELPLVRGVGTGVPRPPRRVMGEVIHVTTSISVFDMLRLPHHEVASQNGAMLAT